MFTQRTTIAAVCLFLFFRSHSFSLRSNSFHNHIMSSSVKSSVLTAVAVVGAVVAVQAILEPKAAPQPRKDTAEDGHRESHSTVKSSQERGVGGKPWHHSTVTVTYPTDSTMCDYPYSVPAPGEQRPVIRAGALLKLIDIVAGIAARRHADGSCVTISLDNVLFLSPIHLGDLVRDKEASWCRCSHALGQI